MTVKKKTPHQREMFSKTGKIKVRFNPGRFTRNTLFDQAQAHKPAPLLCDAELDELTSAMHNYGWGNDS